MFPVYRYGVGDDAVWRYLGDDEAKRFVEQIVTNSDPDGIPKDELDKAIDAFSDMVISAAMVDNWRSGHLAVEWSVQRQDLIWVVTPEGEAAVERATAR